MRLTLVGPVGCYGYQESARSVSKIGNEFTAGTHWVGVLRLRAAAP